MPLYLPSSTASGTWANRPSTVPAAGTMYFATDVGENGTLLISNGTRWRPVNGDAALDTIVASETGITGTERIVMQTLLPAGLLQAGDALRLRLTVAKSGTTDTGVLVVRLGTNGTTADTALTGMSALVMMAAASLSGGGVYDIKVVSVTSLQPVGAGPVNVQHGYQTINAANANVAATTVTSLATTAQYLSIGAFSNGATNTVSVTSGQIQLITP